MHELSIAENILEIVERYRQEKGFSRLTGIRLRVGLLSAVDEDALRFAFESLLDGGPHAGAGLDVEQTFPEGRCSCGETFEVRDMLYTCPRCGSPTARLTGGDELDIVELKVE
jgi:hydrogenase nickel incorporation protein HypA/HybF